MTATFEALVQAYLDCRRSKRNSTSAMAFELHVERNLCSLYDALASIETMDRADLHATGNSYFGLLRQASHSHGDRVALAKALRYRSFTVDGELTRIFRGKQP